MQKTIHKIINNVSEKMLLYNIVDMFKRNFGLISIIGAEIEFYSNFNVLDDKIYNIIKERGLNQYEIRINPTHCIRSLIDEMQEVYRYIAREYADVIFDPKPYPNDYGNGLHFHINFIDSDDQNFFDDTKNIELAANGICKYMMSTFLLFATNESDYLRRDMLSPTHVSWGNNNRTVAVRIPDSIPKRLEHRLASNNTNPEIGLFIILKSIYCAMIDLDFISIYPKIYGNASDAQYNLCKLPDSIEEAALLLDESFF